MYVNIISQVSIKTFFCIAKEKHYNMKKNIIFWLSLHKSQQYYRVFRSELEFLRQPAANLKMIFWAQIEFFH